MSNLSDFFGGGGGGNTSVYGITPVEVLASYPGTAYNGFGHPENTGGSVHVSNSNASWYYYEQGSLVWSIPPTAVTTSTDIVGVCWYSQNSLLFVFTDAATTYFIREVSIVDGSFSGVSVDLTVSNSKISADEINNGIWHKADLTGFYIGGADYLVELDNAFSVVKETSANGRMTTLDGLSVLIQSNTNAYSDGASISISNNAKSLGLTFYRAEGIGLTPSDYFAGYQLFCTDYNGFVQQLGRAPFRASMASFSKTIKEAYVALGGIL